MVGKNIYSSVPTAVDLENNSNQKKYTINRKPGGLVISKPLCTLMAIGALLLAILVGLIVFFFVPRCSPGLTNSLENINSQLGVSNDQLINTPFISDIKEIDERLPRSIEPSQYRLQIRPYLNNETTHGVVTITINVKETTSEIILHVKNLEIQKESVEVKSSTGTTLKVTDQDYIEGQKYRIGVNELLTKDRVYELTIAYKGYMDRHLQGFYRSRYEDLNSNNDNKLVTKFAASTQFSPTDARRAFPCFDEPSFKANFTISIARPSEMTSISNMKIDRSEQDLVHTAWIWDHYATTPKMSTYLVAFIVSDLQPYGSSDKQIKIWARKSLISNTRYAAEFTPKVLRFLESYFDIKFPLPKIDVVAVPEFGFSAMENWGLITFKEDALLHEDEESDIDNVRAIAIVMSHELSHQWFGNLVTPKWWNDLWLKEGFATYLQYLGVNFAEPSWRIDEEFIMSETNVAFASDALKSSHAISFNVKNNHEIRQAFNTLSYKKGACIIRMMNHFLGEKTFKTGLISFLKKYQYGNADREDLFESLTSEAHASGALDQSFTIKEIMDSWTSQPGFPVISVIADRPNNKLIISQKRFLYDSNQTDTSTWWVPISIITSTDPNFEGTKPTVWLKNEPTVTISLNVTDWYLVNINQTGFFIVNYDETNWRLLSQAIMTLPSLTRAQLISDSMDLARANLLDYDIPLKMLAHMALHDRDIMYVPTRVAFKKLEFLSDILVNTPVFGDFEIFQTTIFKTTYRNVEADKDYYSNDYLKQNIRRSVLKWACRRTDSECAIRSHHMFRTWMEKNIRVPANLRKVVYCTAIRQGTEAEWNFAYDHLQRTHLLSERKDLLNALGCTTKKWLLSRYSNHLVISNSSIRIQDAGSVLTSVANNNDANMMAFDFLRQNWNNITEHYGNGFNIVGKMVKTLARFMNTEYQLAELIRFRNEVKGNLGAASQAFDITIEEVRGKVAWMKNNYHSVEKWLTDHRYNYNLL